MWFYNNFNIFYLFFQVFDVVLNGDLTIASDLDVFERVGRGVAHDEYIDFEVKGVVHQIVSPISNSKSTNIFNEYLL